VSAFERTLKHHPVSYRIVQWRRQDFVTGAEVRYGSIGGLEYEVPQSRLYCLCINVALCSTAVRCICRVIPRSSMTMKAHTYYVIFGRPPIGGGSFPPSPLAAPLVSLRLGDAAQPIPTSHILGGVRMRSCSQCAVATRRRGRLVSFAQSPLAARRHSMTSSPSSPSTSRSSPRR